MTKHKLGTTDRDQGRIAVLASLMVEWFHDDPKTLIEAKHGVKIDISPIRLQYTIKQERGYRFLLNEWLKLNPMPGVDHDTLHKWVCCNHFGKIDRELPDGTIDWIPTRTTTKAWDNGERRYVKDRLPIEAYTDLIAFTYRVAAEGEPSVVLPDLKPFYERMAA